MLISLCVILAAVQAVRKRYISPTDERESEAEVIYSGNPLKDAVALSQVADNRSTTLLQLRGPPPKVHVRYSEEPVEKVSKPNKLAKLSKDHHPLGNKLAKLSKDHHPLGK